MWRSKARPSEPVRVLVRHADAGLRSEWRGSDEWRGLTDAGHGQARAIVRMIEDLPVERILSSPSLRCRQTVVPLALAQALDVEPCWQLGACVAPEDLIALLADPATASAVVCTHRETLQTAVRAPGRRVPGGRRGGRADGEGGGLDLARGGGRPAGPAARVPRFRGRTGGLTGGGRPGTAARSRLREDRRRCPTSSEYR